MDRDVINIVSELVEQIGSEPKLAKRLGISQASINRYIKSGQKPSKEYWQRITALYGELKGWRYGSLDDMLIGHDEETQQGARDLLRTYLRGRPRRIPHR